MYISPFFQNLRSAYVAELEDMSHDTEGLFVLQTRLAQRRGELDFLVHMLEPSPEMVAVVFHKAFTFKAPMALHQLLGREPEDLPDWDSFADAITIAPWADAMVLTIRAQPAGDWFMTVAAASEYMFAMPSGSSTDDRTDDEDAPDDIDGADQSDDLAYLSADDDTGAADARTREEAGADWLAEQGFDRKD